MNPTKCPYCNEDIMDEDEWSALTAAIRNTRMDVPTRDDGSLNTDGMSDEAINSLLKRMDDFDLAKSILLGQIADAVGKVDPSKRNEEFFTNARSLAEAMRLAETEGDETIRAKAYKKIEDMIGVDFDPDRAETYSFII